MPPLSQSNQFYQTHPVAGVDRAGSMAAKVSATESLDGADAGPMSTKLEVDDESKLA